MLRIHDPQVPEQVIAGCFRRQQGVVIVHETPLAAAEGSSAIILLTNWVEYRPNNAAGFYDALYQQMEQPTSGEDIAGLGFSVHIMGRPNFLAIVE
ncbi:hypothetical protein FRX31_035521 [Thalictrum thalictroides]|uniref:Uncharacterized protein n=1 Tax=Thalictrum thalictroides TaxID=46969 RepID=A0A7J6UQN3_THATH|nr:hypothetical protein FRX31_035521 [Thalictrum thalictroides]